MADRLFFWKDWGMSENRDRLRAFEECLRAFRRLQKDITVNTLLVFLEISKNPEGITQKLIKDKLDLHQSSVSRNLHALSEYHWLRDKETKLKRPGMGLIKHEQDPYNDNIKIFSLSRKGLEFFKKIKADLEK